MNTRLANVSSFVLRSIPSHRIRKKYAKLIGPYLEGVPAKTAYGFYMLSNYYDNTCRHAFEGSYGYVADFIQRIPTEATYIDIGANQGGTVLLAALSSEKKSTILAFEPSLRIFSILKENLSLNEVENVKAFNVAISSQKEDLYIDDGDPDNSGRSRISNRGSKVQAQPLDSYFIQKEEGEKSDIYVKIDTEGFEMEVLRGMKHLLASKQVKGLAIEIDDRYLSRFGAHSKEVYEYMRYYRYRPKFGSHSEHYDEIFLLEN